MSFGSETTDLTESIQKTKEYVNSLKMFIESMEKLKPKDRLEHSMAMQTCLNSILLSLAGWNNWLTNLPALNEITIEEFNEMFPKIRKLSIDFLKIDIEITSKKITEAVTKLKEKTKSGKTTTKTHYQV